MFYGYFLPEKINYPIFVSVQSFGHGNRFFLSQSAIFETKSTIANNTVLFSTNQITYILYVSDKIF